MNCSTFHVPLTKKANHPGLLQFNSPSESYSTGSIKPNPPFKSCIHSIRPPPTRFLLPPVPSLTYLCTPTSFPSTNFPKYPTPLLPSLTLSTSPSFFPFFPFFFFHSFLPCPVNVSCFFLLSPPFNDVKKKYKSSPDHGCIVSIHCINTFER